MIKESNFIQAYFKYDIIRSFDEIRALMDQYDYVYSSLKSSTGFVDFLKRLEDYEASKHRTFSNSSYKERHGALFTVLLPKNNLDRNQKIRFASLFVKKMTQLEKLHYCVLETYRGKANYLHIYIADREEHDVREVKKYKRDYYQNVFSKKMTNKEDKDAVLIREKGSTVYDKNGNIVYEKEGFSSIKSRIFCYSKKNSNEDGSSSWKRFRKMVFDIIESIINELKISFINGKKFKKRYAKYDYSIYTKHIIACVNQTMRYIEDKISYYLDQESKEIDPLIAYRYEEDPHMLIYTEKGKKILSLFYKYKTRFENNSFHVGETKHKISHTKVHIVHSNLELLQKLFDEDLEKILNNV